MLLLGELASKEGCLERLCEGGREKASMCQTSTGMN